MPVFFLSQVVHTLKTCPCLKGWDKLLYFFFLIGALMGLKDTLQGALTEEKRSDRKTALSFE